MRRTLQLVAVLLLIAGVTATCAQIHLKRDKPHAEDLQWLWQYAKPTPNGQKPALLADSRFSDLLKNKLKAPQFFWGNGLPLNEAASVFLAGDGRVIATANRYLMITGCVIDQCTQRGLLWIDLGAAEPLLVFAAMRWEEQSRTPDEKNAPFSLWLFPDHNLDPQHVPVQLQNALAKWTEPDGCAMQQIHLAAIVDTDGTPHIATADKLGIHSTICTSNSTGI